MRATADLLVEIGYSNLTMAAVAERAPDIVLTDMRIVRAEVLAPTDFDLDAAIEAAQYASGRSPFAGLF